METKYLAQSGNSTLGSVHSTEFEASKEAESYRDWTDRMTGYLKVFGCHSREPEPVRVMFNVCPTAEEYVKALAEYEEEVKKLEEEIKLMKKERFAKFNDILLRYVNLATEYNFHDFVKVTYRRNGRKRVVNGIVYDVWVTKNGEIRPQIGHKYGSEGDELVSVEVIKRREEMDDEDIYRILHGIH